MLEAWGFMTPAYVEEQLSFLLSTDQPHTYVQRGTNILQTIFKKHLQDLPKTMKQSMLAHTDASAWSGS